MQNTQSALVYDKWLHAAFGFDNWVFTLFLQPWQKVLGKTRNRGDDDTTNIIEHGTSLVQAALADAASLMYTALTSPSPKERLPNNGSSLLPSTSPFCTGVEKLNNGLDTDDAGSDVLGRRETKCRALENAMSSGAMMGTHPS